MLINSPLHKFYLTHLYPQDMSIYGDMGNIIALKYRLKKYGLEVVYQTVNKYDLLPLKTDIYFIGGGQDKEQHEIFRDLCMKKNQLIQDVEDGAGLLAICGGYQLLGKSFVTGDDLTIQGIELFDVQTTAPNSQVSSRCIGNLVVKTKITGKEEFLVGFENHSGQTEITNPERTKPLGEVIVGFGNNSRSEFEGAVYKNAIGTYLHGSCLPKNPELADYLIFKALDRQLKKGEIDKNSLQKIKNTIFDQDINIALKKQLLERFVSVKK